MKKLLLIATLVVAAMQVSAANVDLAVAKMTAHRFMQSESGKRFNGVPINDVKLLHAEASAVRADQPVYYIFNSDRGFVIVAGDDRAHLILGYGDRPLDLKRMPDNMKFWLSTYKTQIEYLQSHPGMVVDQPKLNKRFTTPTVAPMLTAEWDQDAPYNNYCVFNGTTCLTGCPATSLSMVFYYWKYPTDPTPEVEGYTNEVSGYNFEIPALPSITFDWDNMLDKYTGNYSTAQAKAVSYLMRYIGQEEHMMYSPGSSGAYGADILRAVKFFGYDEETAELVFKSVSDDYGNETEYINDEDWAVMLQTELAEGRPVVYCAYDYDDWDGWSGHAFNVDGYKADDNTYHVNWGWSGDGNGDFVLNAFSSGGYTFNVEQLMIMGIKPPVQGPSIKVNPSRMNLNAYVDQSATATFTVKGQELTDAITLTLNDESGFFSIDANSVAVSEQEAGKVITLTYAPQASGNHTATVTLSSPGVEDKTVTIYGTAVLETHVPVMLPADEAFINLTQFRADWTDETADKYVDSYTLEVSTRPALLSALDGSLYPGSYQTTTLTEPWSGNGVSVGNSAYYFKNYSGDGYIAFTVPEGYSDDIFTMQITTVDGYYGYGNITVGSNQTAAVGHEFNQGETYSWLVTASEGEKITITSTEALYSPDMTMIKVYVGDINEMDLIRSTEEGDENYRLVTGITDMSYTVKNLAEAGTFYFKVRATYIDGTQSRWSHSQKVTLFANGPEYELGDVNDDGSVTISDVTALIDFLLSGDASGINQAAADCNQDNSITISDVTALIDFLLAGSWN